MSAKLSLNIERSHDELGRITGAVDDLGHRESWSNDLLFRVHLVLEELVLNIIDYGFDDGKDDHELEVVLTSDDDALTIEITDDGFPFDPLQDAKTPDVNAPLEDRPIGGLGVHLVRTMMDEMHYRRDHGKNHLTLVARRHE
jgi:anti-sigma regulatory factor (Ser/Thr protein kinase)